MKNRWQFFIGSTRTARTQNGVLLPDNLRLDKQIAESGVREVGESGIEINFRITCDFTRS